MYINYFLYILYFWEIKIIFFLSYCKGYVRVFPLRKKKVENQAINSLINKNAKKKKEKRKMQDKNAKGLDIDRSEWKMNI